jgi:hypothetical protein
MVLFTVISPSPWLSTVKSIKLIVAIHKNQNIFLIQLTRLKYMKLRIHLPKSNNTLNHTNLMKIYRQTQSLNVLHHIKIKCRLEMNEMIQEIILMIMIHNNSITNPKKVSENRKSWITKCETSTSFSLWSSYGRCFDIKKVNYISCVCKHVLRWTWDTYWKTRKKMTLFLVVLYAMFFKHSFLKTSRRLQAVWCSVPVSYPWPRVSEVDDDRENGSRTHGNGGTSWTSLGGTQDARVFGMTPFGI